MALADGVVLTVEWSDTPNGPAWQTSGVGAPAVISTSGSVQRVKTSLPSSANTRYSRLRVTRNG